MAARKKVKRKAKKRTKKKAARRKPRAAPKASGDLVVRVAEQMAGVIERGLKRTLAKLPRSASTAAAKEKLRNAIAALRRQADAMREQAHGLEARGAEAVAAVWRPVGDRLDKAAAELGRRLGR